mgnify:FL=1
MRKNFLRMHEEKSLRVVTTRCRTRESTAQEAARRKVDEKMAIETKTEIVRTVGNTGQEPSYEVTVPVLAVGDDCTVKLDKLTVSGTITSAMGIALILTLDAKSEKRAGKRTIIALPLNVLAVRRGTDVWTK